MRGPGCKLILACYILPALYADICMVTTFGAALFPEPIFQQEKCSLWTLSEIWEVSDIGALCRINGGRICVNGDGVAEVRQ